jgi:hypothetical protein
MANHYRAIGFDVSSEEQFEELLDRIANNSDEIEIEGGRMFCWSPVEGAGNEGAQVWLFVDNDWNFRGCSPHFAGSSRVSLGLTEMRPTPEFWEGLAYGWVNPPSGATDSGDYPLLFQIPDSTFKFHIAPTGACRGADRGLCT